MRNDSDSVFKKMVRDTNRIHRAALRPAKSRGPGKRQDGVKYKVDNKLKDTYGETDLNTKVIKINKKLHKKDKESMIDTIVHEHMHLKHPLMHEKTVRRLTPKKVKKMTKKSKARLYNKFN